MYFHRYRRRIHVILPFLERLLRTGGHPNNFPGTGRQNTGIQTPPMLDDIIIVTKGTIEKHESEVKETNEKIRRSRI